MFICLHVKYLPRYARCVCVYVPLNHFASNLVSFRLNEERDFVWQNLISSGLKKFLNFFNANFAV